jgi:hypothetical protein
VSEKIKLQMPEPNDGTIAIGYAVYEVQAGVVEVDDTADADYIIRYYDARPAPADTVAKRRQRRKRKEV